MATFTDVWSWSLVPENADPAWPLFDRLIGEIDYTLGSIDRRQRGVAAHAHATLAGSSTPDFFTFIRSSTQFVQASFGPRGPFGAPFQVSSGALVQFDLNFWPQPRGGEPQIKARLIVHPGSLNITGDSAWGIGNNPLPFGQTADFTATASLGQGAYTATVDVLELNPDGGADILNTPFTLLVYQYERSA